MRGAIIDSVFSLMEQDPRLFFVTADMGINLVEKIADKYPDRYLNVGIAEQNMIGICSGLVNAGFRPVAYTISNFAIHRCFEQIRNDICIHHKPVIILGTSTGYDNASLGPTHHIVDDWGSLKAFPGIDIYCPSTVAFAESAISRLIAEGRPAYVRIPKGELKDPAKDDDLILVGEPSGEVLLACYGGTVNPCLEVTKSDKKVSTLIFNKLHPLDGRAIKEISERFQRVIVVEDQFPRAGLYGSLSTAWIEHNVSSALDVVSPDRDYVLDVGTSSDYFLQKWGLDTSGIQAHISSSR